MADDFFGPLGLGDLETPEKRGKFINIEAIDAYIEKATMETVTITGGTFSNITVTGSIELGDDFYSTNWDGTVPLSLPDASATTGFALDGNAGTAQFQTIYAEGGELGTLNVTGDLTLTSGASLQTGTTGEFILIDGAAGKITFQSAASEEVTNGYVTAQNFLTTSGFLELRSPVLGDGSSGTNYGYGGYLVGSNELASKGTVYAPAVGAGNWDAEWFGIASVTGSGDAQVFLTSLSDSGNSDMTFNVQSTSGTATFAIRNADSVTLEGQVQIDDGTAGAPALTNTGDTDTGLYFSADNTVAFAGGGALLATLSNPSGSIGRLSLGSETNDYIQMDGADESWDFYINSTKIWGLDRTGNESRIYGAETNDWIFNDNVAEEWGFALDSTEYFRILKSVVVVGAPLFRLPVKGTTGDPTATDQGDMYVNSVDNVLKVYEGGSWRTVASW